MGWAQKDCYINAYISSEDRNMRNLERNVLPQIFFIPSSEEKKKRKRRGENKERVFQKHLLKALTKQIEEELFYPNSPENSSSYSSGNNTPLINSPEKKSHFRPCYFIFFFSCSCSSSYSDHFPNSRSSCRSQLRTLEAPQCPGVLNNGQRHELTALKSFSSLLLIQLRPESSDLLKWTLSLSKLALAKNMSSCVSLRYGYGGSQKPIMVWAQKILIAIRKRRKAPHCPSVLNNGQRYNDGHKISFLASTNPIVPREHRSFKVDSLSLNSPWQKRCHLVCHYAAAAAAATRIIFPNSRSSCRSQLRTEEGTALSQRLE
ncbi:hypothetical protein CEXT_129251 [Caerostris extrusa]|uniref:Maturase K n=1 Tax=Caerostris extrusa TaxID=172846 RepID=A0AAV4UHU5_CAEEX|nr:hypothetical protein CEXT_129251 [Caerostris extrusa]